MADPIFKVACPACGAPVSFLSAASAMAVCSYCNSTLLRDADTVRDMGKISAVLPDYSPIQIGTSGVFEGQAFNVIGRRQLQYEEGYWNEWYALFDDGSSGWLADASGQFVFTREHPDKPESPPDFSQLRPGQGFVFAGHLWQAADVRMAKCVANTGELPSVTLPSTLVKAADFRDQGAFMTLDWSEGSPPVCYIGKAVTLDGMKCQFLREGNVIADTAGRLRGKISQLACPSCGSPIKYIPGLTEYMVCPACHAETHKTPEQAVVMQANDRLATQAQATTLKLGESGNIGGVLWDVIGIMVRKEVGEMARWTEYLLFNVVKGFMWLVESSEGWQQVRVLDEWPQANPVKLAGQSFEHQYQYTGEVVWAAGAFNWRVKVGDRVVINDYRHAGTTLTSEGTPEELGWSSASSVGGEQLRKWFSQSKGLANVGEVKTGGGDVAELEHWAKIACVILVVVNIPAWLAGDFEILSWLIVGGGCALLWLPALFTRRT